MIFEVHRQSDDRRGMPGASPTAGAVFNVEEKRWEIQFDSVNTLVDHMEGEGCPFLVIPVGCESEDLPVIQIQDEYVQEED